MKKKILYLFSLLMVASFSLQSCSNDDETIMEPEQGMEYGITVNISADEGEKSSSNSTRFIDNTVDLHLNMMRISSICTPLPTRIKW